MTRPLLRPTEAAREQRAREVQQLRERLTDAEHTMTGLREQLAAHRATLTAAEDRAVRAEAERDAEREQCCRLREVVAVAQLARESVINLLLALDRLEQDMQVSA